MRSVRLALLGTLLTGGALAQSPSSPASPPASAQTQAPADDVVVEEVWVSVAEVPADYFTRAQSRFSRDREAAAKDLRKGAAVMELEAKHAKQASKAELEKAASEVRTLARGVEQGTVRSARELQKPLARAAQALAHDHQLRAEEAWSAKEEKRAGHELRATAHYLEHGARWTGKESERAVKATVRDTRKLAGDLIEGVGFVPKEVGDGIALAGKQVERLGQWVKPSSAPAQGIGGSGTPSEPPPPTEKPEETR